MIDSEVESETHGLGRPGQFTGCQAAEIDPAPRTRPPMLARWTVKDVQDTKRRFEESRPGHDRMSSSLPELPLLGKRLRTGHSSSLLTGRFSSIARYLTIVP